MKIRNKRIGIINVAYSALHSLLELPEEATILKVAGAWNGMEVVSLIVESPYLSEIEEGMILPVIRTHDLGGFDE